LTQAVSKQPFVRPPATEDAGRIGIGPVECKDFFTGVQSSTLRRCPTNRAWTDRDGAGSGAAEPVRGFGSITRR
jgi:hypothetical protein